MSCEAENRIGLLVVDVCESFDHHVTAGGSPRVVLFEQCGFTSAWPGSNYSLDTFARLRLDSPVQRATETDKAVAFPILSPRSLTAFKRLGTGFTIDDPNLRAAIAGRVVMATLQPASGVINAIRERLSIVLAGIRQSILIPVRRPVDMTGTTPAMRLGIRTPAESNRLDEAIARAEDAFAAGDPAGGAGPKGKDRRGDERPDLPNLARILIQPRLVHGTPM